MNKTMIVTNTVINYKLTSHVIKKNGQDKAKDAKDNTVRVI